MLIQLTPKEECVYRQTYLNYYRVNGLNTIYRNKPEFVWLLKLSGGKKLLLTIVYTSAPNQKYISAEVENCVR